MLHESALLEQIASGAVPIPGLTDDAPDIAVDIPVAAKPAREKFRFVSIGDMKRRYKPPSWVIDGFIRENSTSLVFGDSAVGKSFLVIDWACCIATGNDWNGLDVTCGPVFYIAGEGHDGFVMRVRAWEIVNKQTTDDAPIYFSERPAALLNAESAQDVTSAIEEMTEELGRPALIVIDTMHRNFGGGDENSSADFGVFMNRIDAMRLSLKCSIIVVHHSGHGDKTRSRGSSSIKGSMDHEYCLTQEADERRLLACTKMKDAPKPEKAFFELRGVELDLLDAKGRQETSAVLVKAWNQDTPEPERKASSSKALDFIRDAIKVTGSNQREVVRKQFYALYPGKPEAQQKAFVRGWNEYIKLLETEL